MYGKTLNDFPERAEIFLMALSDLSEAEINAGFEMAVTVLAEFPVPAQIREFAVEAARISHHRLKEESLRNQRLLEDKIKDSRFDETTAEERRQEFAELVAKAARKMAL